MEVDDVVDLSIGRDSSSLTNATVRDLRALTQNAGLTITPAPASTVNNGNSTFFFKCYFNSNIIAKLFFFQPNTIQGAFYDHAQSRNPMPKHQILFCCQQKSMADNKMAILTRIQTTKRCPQSLQSRQLCIQCSLNHFLSNGAVYFTHRNYQLQKFGNARGTCGNCEKNFEMRKLNQSC